MQANANLPQGKKNRTGNVAKCLVKSDEDIKKYVDLVVNSYPDKIENLKKQLTQYHEESTVNLNKAIEWGFKTIPTGKNKSREEVIGDLHNWASGEMKQLIISEFTELKQKADEKGVGSIINNIDPEDKLFNDIQVIGKLAIENQEKQRKTKMALEYLEVLLNKKDALSANIQDADDDTIPQSNWYGCLEEVVDLSCANADAVQSFRDCMNSNEVIDTFLSDEKNETNDLSNGNELINGKLKELEEKISQINARQRENTENQNRHEEKISDHSKQIEELEQQQKKLIDNQKLLLDYLEEKKRINAEREKLVDSGEQVKIFYQTFLADLSGALLALFLLQNNMELITAEKGKVLDVSKKGSNSSSAVSTAGKLTNVAEKAEGIITKMASVNPEAIARACDILGSVGANVLSISEKAIDAAKVVEALPFVGLGINLVKTGVDYGINKYEKNKLKHTRHYFLGMTPKGIEKLSDSIARKIAFSYLDQIKLLNSKSAKHLARCGIECLIVNLLNNAIAEKFKDGVLNFLFALRFQPVTVDSWKLFGFKTSFNLPFSKSLLMSAENQDMGFTENMIYRQTGYSYMDSNGLKLYFSNDRDGKGKFPLPNAPETVAKKIGYMLITKEEFDQAFHEYASIDNQSQLISDEKHSQDSDQVKSHDHAFAGKQNEIDRLMKDNVEMKHRIEVLENALSEQKKLTDLLIATFKDVLWVNEERPSIEKEKSYYLFTNNLNHNLTNARNTLNGGIKKLHQPEETSGSTSQHPDRFFSNRDAGSSLNVPTNESSSTNQGFSKNEKK